MKYLPFIFFLAAAINSFGQDTIRTSLGVPGKRYTSSQIECFVEGYKTKSDILSLFKPEEIVMKREHSAGRSSDSTFIMKISVKNPEHPVLKYFQHQASMLLNGKLLPHNVIPDIPHKRISDIIFHDNAGEGAADILEVVLYGEEYHNNKAIKYTSEKRKIEYYDLDGKIYTAEELRKMRLKPGQLKKIDTLFGKEAVEKYGDPKYADGILIGTLK